jgi:hypothetical protein
MSNLKPDNYVVEGPVNWDLITKAVKITNMYYQGIENPSLDFNQYLPKAYRLIYLFLSKQENPLDPAHSITAHSILREL